LALAPSQYWFARGLFEEGCRWLERARPDTPAGNARRLMLLCHLHWGLGDLDASEAAATRVLAEAPPGCGLERAEVLSNLALAAFDRGEYARARSHLDAMTAEAAPDSIRVGDRFGILALVALVEGALDESVEAASAVLGDDAGAMPQARAYAMLTLAEARRRQGAPADARRIAADAYRIFDDCEQAEGLIYALLALAAAAADAGELRRAAALLEAFRARPRHGLNAVAREVLAHVEAAVGTGEPSGRDPTPEEVGRLVAGIVEPA
jgi:ATP/maltotriose-dependent transcriptional regulator MalT